MKKHVLAAFVLVSLTWVGIFLIPAKAQNPTLTPVQWTVGSGTHSNCTVTSGATNYCFASDGPWVSVNGAAYVSMLPTAGVQLAIVGTAPITATTNGSTVTIALPSAALKTQIDTLGLAAAAAPVQ